MKEFEIHFSVSVNEAMLGGNAKQKLTEGISSLLKPYEAMGIYFNANTFVIEQVLPLDEEELSERLGAIIGI